MEEGPYRYTRSATGKKPLASSASTQSNTFLTPKKLEFSSEKVQKNKSVRRKSNHTPSDQYLANFVGDIRNFFESGEKANNLVVGANRRGSLSDDSQAYELKNSQSKQKESKVTRHQQDSVRLKCYSNPYNGPSTNVWKVKQTMSGVTEESNSNVYTPNFNKGVDPKCNEAAKTNSMEASISFDAWMNMTLEQWLNEDQSFTHKWQSKVSYYRQNMKQTTKDITGINSSSDSDESSEAESEPEENSEFENSQ